LDDYFKGCHESKIHNDDLIDEYVLGLLGSAGYCPFGLEFTLFHSFLQIINAAITPGTHPAIVSRMTRSMDPHPLSNTASGGKRMHRMTLPKLMV